jgi:iron complex outermembrane receptor protein
MATFPPSLHPRRAAAAAAGPAKAAALAQTTTITVTGRSRTGAGVAGFGDVPLASAACRPPCSAAGQLRDAGITSSAALTGLDAGSPTPTTPRATGPASRCAASRWTTAYNYRRDGLPINAETALPWPTRNALELLKGTSGIQAGTSAPGGLVNLVVKRPTGACAT